MKKRSLKTKFLNSLKKRLKKLRDVFNLFLFSLKKINDFQRYDNLVLCIESEKLFLNNIDISNGKYLKYNIILNYMGIKALEEDNQKHLKIIDKFIEREELKNNIRKFKEEKIQSPIRVSYREKILIGEAFKLSMVLYKKKDIIAIEYDFKEKAEFNYNFKWLKDNFTKNEIEIILQEYNILRSRFYPQTNMIIWAPAHKYLNLIKKEISDKAYITNEINLKFSTQNELKHFLEKVYCNGNNVFGRVEEKWNRIKNEDLKIIILWIETDLIKKEKGFLIDIVKLKKKIRNKIKKKMKNYVFDSVIHMGGTKSEIEELNEVLSRYIKMYNNDKMDNEFCKRIY